jgi:5-formyltetrahydrofolate cyclo-ligase
MMVNTLVWSGTGNAKGTTKTKIRSLQQLLDVLVNVSVEDIASEAEQNRESVEAWIRTNFPKKLQVIAHFKEDYTPQQWFEQLVRDLRQIVG